MNSEMLDLGVLAREATYTALLFLWVLIVVFPLTKNLYDVFTKKLKMPHNKAIYYNRKIIHILAGGLPAVLIPVLGYKSPVTIVPMVILLFLATLIPHRRGKLLYWFQDPENINEVNFVLMWGIVMTLSWLFFNGDWRYGVLPVSFMAFGDGVTGIVRNALFSERNKSWTGNLAMMVFCVPVGYHLFGLPGAISGLVASIVEHVEIHESIDDNITVPITAFAVLILAQYIGL